MATPFLSSEEYDERAHRFYNDGHYDRALETLKEGLALYPHAVELHVGLGYTRLAREEFAWAKQSFDEALALDPEHEDAMVGLGEVLLRLGRRREALELFDRVRRGGCADDLDLLLSMGRALYRDELYEEARDVFADATALHPESADAFAALGYTLHRLGRPGAARRELRRALRLDPQFHEARIYLGHLLYDRGDWEGALRQFERVPAAEHWDSLALWRLIELKRTIDGLRHGHPLLAEWEARREELDARYDPIDELLAEIEQRARDANDRRAAEADHGETAVHRVRLPDGQTYAGSWLDIVRQLRDAVGLPHETIAQFMRRHADEQRARSGIGIPADDPEAFLRASARAGLWRIEC
ncbi:MAG TPA: tetratricopeptide repeat protein [Longimicrobiales bacterium]